VPAVSAQSLKKPLQSVSPVWGKALNTELKRARVHVAMNEVLPDIINASGIGAILVGYETLTEPKELPNEIQLQEWEALPVEVQETLKQEKLITFQTIDEAVSRRFYARRLSPADLLWDVEFTGSDYDDSSWVGHSGRMHWAEAKAAFNLDESVKSLVTGSDDRTDVDKLRRQYPEHEGGQGHETDMVSYDELFYWDYRFNTEQKYYECIKRIVFVEGLDKPVIDEKWKGQRFLEPSPDRPNQPRVYIGARRFPIRRFRRPIRQSAARRSTNSFAPARRWHCSAIVRSHSGGAT
jgi:hypothetical protein